MKKKTQPNPTKGDATAVDIYIAVGIALTSWEACEDALVGVFRTLCAAKEPTLFATYISAPRHARSDMLRAAMKTYSHFFKGDEAQKLLEILKALDQYAQTRNEICARILRQYRAQLQWRAQDVRLLSLAFVA